MFQNHEVIPEMQIEENNFDQHPNLNRKYDGTQKKLIICFKLDSTNLSLMLSRNKCSNVR